VESPVAIDVTEQPLQYRDSIGNRPLYRCAQRLSVGPGADHCLDVGQILRANQKIDVLGRAWTLPIGVGGQSANQGMADARFREHPRDLTHCPLEPGYRCKRPAQFGSTAWSHVTVPRAGNLGTHGRVWNT
jgi:hypothetical protein